MKGAALVIPEGRQVEVEGLHSRQEAGPIILPRIDIPNTGYYVFRECCVTSHYSHFLLYPPVAQMDRAVVS